VEAPSVAAHRRAQPQQVLSASSAGDDHRKPDADALLSLDAYDVGCGHGGPRLTEYQCRKFAALDLQLRYGGSEQEPSAPSGCYRLGGVVFYSEAEGAAGAVAGDRVPVCLRKQRADAAARPGAHAALSQNKDQQPEADSHAGLWQQVEAIASEERFAGAGKASSDVAGSHHQASDDIKLRKASSDVAGSRHQALMRSEQNSEAREDAPDLAVAASRRRCCCRHRRRRQGGGDAMAYGAHHKCASADDGVPWDLRCGELHNQWDCP